MWKRQWHISSIVQAVGIVFVLHDIWVLCAYLLSLQMLISMIHETAALENVTECRYIWIYFTSDLMTVIRWLLQLSAQSNVFSMLNYKNLHWNTAFKVLSYDKYMCHSFKKLYNNINFIFRIILSRAIYTRYFIWFSSLHPEVVLIQQTKKLPDPHYLCWLMQCLNDTEFQFSNIFEWIFQSNVKNFYASSEVLVSLFYTIWAVCTGISLH